MLRQGFTSADTNISLITDEILRSIEGKTKTERTRSKQKLKFKDKQVNK
jgi:hypothetical protein